MYVDAEEELGAVTGEWWVDGDEVKQVANQLWMQWEQVRRFYHDSGEKMPGPVAAEYQRYVAWYNATIKNVFFTASLGQAEGVMLASFETALQNTLKWIVSERPDARDSLTIDAVDLVPDPAPPGEGGPSFTFGLGAGVGTTLAIVASVFIGGKYLRLW